jgi:hypothetical protein
VIAPRLAIPKAGRQTTNLITLLDPPRLHGAET